MIPVVAAAVTGGVLQQTHSSGFLKMGFVFSLVIVVVLYLLLRRTVLRPAQAAPAPAAEAPVA